MQPAPGLRAALLLSVGSGALVALQARVNAALAGRLGDAVLAAWVSFVTGLALVVVLVVAVPAARRCLPALASRAVRWWYLLGGLGGASVVAAAAWTVPVTGVAPFTVAAVSGQVAGGLAVDGLGLGPGGRRPVTRGRAAGAALAVAAVVVTASGNGLAGDGLGGGAGLMLGVAGGAGVAVAAQQGVNARLRVAVGHPLVATLVNFVVGSAALTVAWLAVGRGVAPVVGDVVAAAGDPWLLVGGPIGVLFIAVNAGVVPVIGVLRQGVAVLAGMLLGAVVLDASAGAAQRPAPVAVTATGVLLALVAVAVVARDQRSTATLPGSPAGRAGRTLQG